MLNEPITDSDLTPSINKNRPQDSIHARTQDIRTRMILWSWNWGPENMWDVEFQRKLKKAREENNVDAFFEDLSRHTRKGRELLQMLKKVGAGECFGDVGVLLDLFSQGLEMGIKVAFEVKFHELKLDKYAPVVHKNTESGLCHYDSEDMEDMESDSY